MRAARRSREEIEQLLARTKLAGSNLAHSRSNNLAHVRRLVQGEQGVTLGIQLVEERLRESPLDPEEVLGTIAGITGCSSDISFEEGFGYISPSATYEGLEAAAVAIKGAVERRDSFVFASGHPANMSEAYEQLAEHVEARGCEVLTDPLEGVEEFFDQKLELRGRVYMATSNGLPAHTHRHEYMRDLLARTGPVGMAVADHGFAGAALNLGIPTVSVMDTNDPGLALAARLGAPVTVIPFNDNSPGAVAREMAAIIIEMMEGPER